MVAELLFTSLQSLLVFKLVLEGLICNVIIREYISVILFVQLVLTSLDLFSVSIAFFLTVHIEKLVTFVLNLLLSGFTLLPEAISAASIAGCTLVLEQELLTVAQPCGLGPLRLFSVSLHIVLHAFELSDPHLELLNVLLLHSVNCMAILFEAVSYHLARGLFERFFMLIDHLGDQILDLFNVTILVLSVVLYLI